MLSFDGNFLSFSLAQGPPRDKYDFAHAHNRLAEFSCKYYTTHAYFRPPLEKNGSFSRVYSGKFKQFVR